MASTVSTFFLLLQEHLSPITAGTQTTIRPHVVTLSLILSNHTRIALPSCKHFWGHSDQRCGDPPPKYLMCFQLLSELFALKIDFQAQRLSVHMVFRTKVMGCLNGLAINII